MASLSKSQINKQTTPYSTDTVTEFMNLQVVQVAGITEAINTCGILVGNPLKIFI